MKNIIPVLFFLLAGCFSTKPLIYPDDYPKDIIALTSNSDSIVNTFHVSQDKKASAGHPLTGKRSRKSIMEVVMVELKHLRYAYNRRLRDVPGLYGKITVTFAISEKGNVVYSKVSSNTIKDVPLADTIAGIIATWKFPLLDVAVDTTEVIYPFAFSQGQSEEDIKLLDIKNSLKGNRDPSYLLDFLKVKSPILQNILDTLGIPDSITFSSIGLKLGISKEGFVNHIDILNSTFPSRRYEKAILDEIRRWKLKDCSSDCTDAMFEYSFIFKKSK
jgi:hypothetical protein